MTDNKSLERLEQIGHLETTLTNQNCNSEVRKRSLDSVGACYYSVRNLSYSSFQSKNTRIILHIELADPSDRFG